MPKDKPRVRKIESITRESPTVVTVRVYDPPTSEATPGQFAMLWMPNSGEIPIAISGREKEYAEFTIKKRGPTTAMIHDCHPGDRIGVRGPYGVGFSEPAGRSIVVAGGYGVSPLRHFYRKYVKNADLEVLLGASTAEELFFLDELEPKIVATESGERGYHGYITEPLKEILSEEEVDRIYAAGPEQMIYQIFKLCKSEDLWLEASLERIMKCGVGVCGSCLIDGFRVCKDGPVANLAQLEGLSEFGEWKRTHSGRKERV